MSQIACAKPGFSQSRLHRLPGSWSLWFAIFVVHSTSFLLADSPSQKKRSCSFNEIYFAITWQSQLDIKYQRALLFLSSFSFACLYVPNFWCSYFCQAFLLWLYIYIWKAEKLTWSSLWSVTYRADCIAEINEVCLEDCCVRILFAELWTTYPFHCSLVGWALCTHMCA